MHPRRFITMVLASGAVGLGCLFQVGCGDDSKTTGTQLQLTEQDRADIENMRSAMKGQRATQKQEQIDRRKRR